MTPNSFTPPSSSSSFSSQEIPQSSLMPSSLKSKGTQRYTSAPNLLVWLEGTLFWASFHVQSVIGVSTNLNPAPEGCFVFLKSPNPRLPHFFSVSLAGVHGTHLEIVFKRNSCYIKPSAGTTSASCGPLFQ